jgi:outer membrane protein insertion porin family
MNFIRGYFSRILLAACLAFGVLGASSLAYSQTIVVEGVSGPEAETIRSYFTGSDQAHINQAIADLSATGQFSKVSARIAGDKVIVSVVESKQVINRVAFEGNSKIKSEQLEVEVQSKARHAYDPAVAAADIDRIKDAYKKFGRAAAQVTSRLVPLPNGRVDLVFAVQEGDKTGVRAIKFVGNQAFSGYRLHGLMQTTEMNFMSWFKNSDVYDPDQIAHDEEAIRKYYMKNGYADFRITNTDVQYQADPGGYVITISMDEGAQYHVSSIHVDSHIPSVDSQGLQRFVKLSPGDVYNATALELSTEAITRDVARQGYAFSDVRPHGDRDAANHTIAIGFNVDDGPKVYIERIEVQGNTRTRDYVIRREFDIGEGDPYNHALIEQGERRLNNLGFFKKVHITNRPGSAPDKVIVIVEVEDQATGSVGISGGYSTTAGFLADISFTESNFLGRGQYVKLTASEGQYSRGWSASFTEPYLFGQRIAGGFDIFHKESDVNRYAYYNNWTTGVALRLGLPITEELTLQPTYSIYQSQITIPNTSSNPYNDCTVPIPGVTPGSFGTVLPLSYYNSCLTNGEASLALKQAAAQGATLTSLVGYQLIYNSLDNPKSPSQGVYAVFKQDFAGLGGDSKFIRETIDARYYYPISDDFIGLIRGQAGQINAWGGDALRIVDNFNVGQSLVRGFTQGGIGPRDISDPTNLAGNSLGGTTYFGGTLEVQFPIFGIPREIGLKGALFADAGTLVNYPGATNFSPLLGLPANTPCYVGNVAPNYTQGNCIVVSDPHVIRSSVGASLIWASPLGPIRFDYAYVLTKGKYDQTQAFSFSGGASF